MIRATLLLLSLIAPAFAVEQANWSGPYRGCDNKSELLKSGHMELGVRIDSADARIADAFRRALDFWSNVLDMSYHVEAEASAGCALALVDGTPQVLETSRNVARAQFADLANFEGWVAFDPHAPEYMSESEMYATAVHELGHIFGLRHNPRANSIMYFLDCDGTSTLDLADLRALAMHHALRVTAQSAIPILSGRLPEIAAGG